MVFGVPGKLKFILVSALFVALGVPLAGSRTIAAEHSPATPQAAAAAKNTAEESVVKENEGASSDPSIPEVKLTSRILFQLIASEIALQRGQPGAAYQTYLTLAEETGDPRIAERAAQIALASNAPKEFRKAVSEWIKLSPDNPKAQEAFIASGIVSNQLDKVAGTAAAFLAKSKDKGAEIIKLQTQLALMKDKAKALSFFRTVTGKYSKFYQTQLGLARLEALNGNVAAAEKYAKNAFKIVENEDTVLTYGSTLLRTNPKEAEQILARYLKKNPNGYCHIDIKKADEPLIDDKKYPKPSDAENPLADMYYYSVPYYTDRVSQMSQEIGIDNRFKEHLAQYSNFWKNKNPFSESILV